MRKYAFAAAFLCLFLLSGCASTEMNRLEGQYSEKEIVNLTKDYIENKYGKAPQIKKINPYQDICGGMDATNFTAFKGFAVETDDYLTFMDFISDGSYSFSDTKQSEDILQDMRSELSTVYSGKAYLSMISTNMETTNDKNTDLPYLSERSQAYQTFYNGNLSDLFLQEKNNHEVYIYMDAVESNADIRSIIHYFQKISDDVTVTEYEPGLYEVLCPYFDDWDYMRRVDHPLYYRRMGKTRKDFKYIEAPYQKIMDGIYIKSEQPVKQYQNIEEGLAYVLQTRPDSVEAMYLPDGSEKGMLVANGLSDFFVLVDTAQRDTQISFYDIGKGGNLYDEKEEPKELLNSYKEMKGEATVIYGGMGYLIFK